MRLCGVLNWSSPSRKNGRFSGKYSAWRGSITNCPASDSTSAKSGFTAPLSVRVLVIPHWTLPPNCGDVRSYPQPFGPGPPVTFSVTDGFTSSTSPRVSPVSPSSVPDCARKEVFERLAGTQESSCRECCTSRTILRSQLCSSPDWYLRLLSGILISIS